MSLRFRIRRALIGGDLYDRAVHTVDSVESAEGDARERAYAFVREVHAEHPRADRSCAVPNCCDKGVN